MTSAFDISTEDLRIGVDYTPPQRMTLEGSDRTPPPEAPRTDPDIALARAREEHNAAVEKVNAAKEKHAAALEARAEATKMHTEAKENVAKVEREHADGLQPFAQVGLVRDQADSTALKLRRTTELENRAADNLRHAEQRAQASALQLQVAERDVRHAEIESLQVEACALVVKLQKLTERMEILNQSDDWNQLRGSLLLMLHATGMRNGFNYDQFLKIWMGGR
jgi:hypothetical protein